jgi:hypothetical protein
VALAVTVVTCVWGAGEALSAMCPQTQYHGGFQAQSALGGKRGAATPAAVSRARGEAVSHLNLVSKGSSISTRKCGSIVSRIASRFRTDIVGNLPLEMQFDSESVQYQPRGVRYQAPGAAAVETVATRSTHSDPGLMIRIGLLLGVAYLVFLTFWFWATRGRPRLRRARSGIDTTRRME